MPALEAFVRTLGDDVYRFPFAVTNSTMSDISYPSLFCGVHPLAPHARFHDQPTIWGLAHAAGHRTFFYSASLLDTV
jgi:hypothetical protein